MEKAAASPLKLALFGYGKMGKMVDRLAPERGHKVMGIRKTKGQLLDLSGCDVIIDFSTGDSILSHIEQAGEAKKNIVIGTTGWEDDLAQVKMLVDKYQIGALYSPNFSIGVHLFLKIVREASALLLEHGEYDVGGMEVHHKEKKDSPSGTSKAIRDMVLKGGRHQMPDFASLRVGKVLGTHTVYFDSPEDTITLTHAAKGREGFAIGAIIAAEWLQKKSGFYTLEDIL